VSAPTPLHESKVPFVGPQAYKVSDAWRFFGRDREAADLIDIVAASRIVLLYSPSGAGKTSLINAAVIPQFPKRFRVLPVISVGGVPSPSPDGVPGNRYVGSAVRSIENALPEAERLPASELAGMPFASYLARRRELVGDDHPELMIFDQFEEILAIDPFDLDAKTEFFEQVGEALRDRQRWAIFSMREEYDAQLDPYRRLVPTGLSTRFRLDLLGTDAAIEAVWRPTRDLPVKITEGAAKKVVADLSQITIEQDGKVVTRQGLYVDPVQLQVVCLRLWQKRPPDTTEITADYIDRTGTNVDVALAEYYGSTVADASSETGVPERPIRAWIGDHLITRHGNRNRVLREPGESRGLDDRVIAFLIDRYLLRTVPGDATWVELAHDRLVQPVRESNETWFRDNLSPLQRHAEAWDKGGRSQDLLLPAGLLKEARTWSEQHSDLVTPTEQQFLARSEEARAHLVWRRVVPAAAVLILLLVALAGWALLERGDKQKEATAASEARATADVARATAESQADLSRVRALAAQAPDQHDAGDDERGALLARQAYLFDVADDSQTSDLVDGSLRRVLSQPLFSVTLDHGDVVLAAVFGEDGAILTTVTGPLNAAAGGSDRPITVWRWDIRGAVVESRSIDWPGRILTAVVVDPEGARLAVGTSDGAILMWDLTKGDGEAVTFRPDGPSVGALAFSSDGARLAAGDVDGALYLWAVSQDTAEPVAEPVALPASAFGIAGLAFRPDGSMLAAGRADGTVDLWDIDTEDGEEGFVPRSLEGHRGAVGALVFSPDGSRLATASSDATIRLWDVPSGETSGESIPSDQVLALAFSPVDGATLAIGRIDGTIALIDLDDTDTAQMSLAGHRGAILAIAFSADGSELATGSGDGSARLWQLGPASAEPVVVVEGGTGEQTSLPAIVEPREVPSQLAVVGRDGSVRWGSYARNLTGAPGGRGGVTALALSPDGSWLAVGGSDGTVQILVQEGAQAPDVTAPPNIRRRVSALAFSPDGLTIAIGSNDGTVRVLSLSGAGDDSALRCPGVGVTALAFSNDGSLASGGDDGSIHVWNPAQPDPGLCVAPDYGDGTASSITALAFDANGEVLASGNSDGTARLVNLKHRDAQPIVLRGPVNVPIRALAFSSDGANLFTAHADGIVRSWIARTDVLADMVCQKVRRNLTGDEWVRFVGLPIDEYQRTCEDLPPGEGAPDSATPVARREGTTST
jgi:WD40 repeat protein